MVDVFELSPLDRRNRKLTEEKEVDALALVKAPPTDKEERNLNSFGYRCRIRGGGEYVQFILEDDNFVGLARCKYKACDSYGNLSGKKDRCERAIIEIEIEV